MRHLQHDSLSWGLALVLSLSGCASLDEEVPEGGDESASASGDKPTNASAESALVSGPNWHVDPDLSGVALPMSADEPRARFVIPPELFFIEGEDFLPLVDASDRVNKDIVNGESRERVAETKIFPASTVVQLIHRFPSDPASAIRICTGTMIGADAVLTAAHCTFDAARQQFASFMLAVPAAYPDPKNPGVYIAPYGTSGAIKLYAHDNYRTGTGLTQTANDVGLVRLKVKLGTSTSTRSASALTLSAKERIWYDGYQGDLVRYQMYASAGLMNSWLDQAKGLFKTSADAHHGASGAGFAKANDISRVFGLVSSGSGTSPATAFNVGIAFNAAMVTKINSWKTAAL
jgi:V8-like Glu-specific endopeptidase